jgi:uncharacterized membrane protein
LSCLTLADCRNFGPPQGQVAEYAYTDGNVAFHTTTLWNGATATDLGTLGGTYSVALAINIADQVAGCATAGDPTRHATLWHGTTTTDINNLLNASTVNAGWVLNEASGINYQGVDC